MSSFWRNKRVLVTGHTGFKGCWLCQWLLMEGAEVMGVALKPDTQRALFEQLKLEEQLYHKLLDIRDSDDLQKEVKSFQPEIIFHLAAQPLVIQSYQQPLETFATNVMGTVHLLDAVHHCPSVKAVVVITTDKVYQPSQHSLPHKESDHLGGHDPYSASKACTELVVSSYRDSFFAKPGAPLIATVRAGNVIGGGDFAANRLIPDICRAWSQTKAVQIRNPNAVRPWQHVLDALNVYLRLAEKLFQGEQALATSWNIGPQQEDMWPVGDIVKRMQTLWQGEAEVQYEQSLFHENPCLMLDSSALQIALDWQPVWKLEQAIETSVAWYQTWAEDGDLIGLTKQQIKEFQEVAKQG